MELVFGCQPALLEGLLSLSRSADFAFLDLCSCPNTPLVLTVDVAQLGQAVGGAEHHRRQVLALPAAHTVCPVQPRHIDATLSGRQPPSALQPLRGRKLSTVCEAQGQAQPSKYTLAFSLAPSPLLSFLLATNL